MFVAINNLFSQGAVKLDQYIIDDYLKNNLQSLYNIYTRNNGNLYVEKAKELATPENFNTNYQEMKKFSLLRAYLKSGIEVDEIYNPDEEDPEIADEQRYQFSQMTIDDILNYLGKKYLILLKNIAPKLGVIVLKLVVMKLESKKKNGRKLLLMVYLTQVII